jgi:hypothetical protein
LAAAEDQSASNAERAEMLMEIAMGLQQRPKDPAQLTAAISLIDNYWKVVEFPSDPE